MATFKEKIEAFREHINEWESLDKEDFIIDLFHSGRLNEADLDAFLAQQGIVVK